MTLQAFIDRVIAHALILEIQDLPTDLATVIRFDTEWDRKWRLALHGKFDA